MKFNNFFLYLVLSSSFGISVADEFESGHTIDNGGFSLEVASGVKKCANLTFNPEIRNPGYLFNVYRYRNGKIMQIGDTVSPNKHTLYNHPTVHAKNTKNFTVKGNDKTNIQIGDFIILDGWKKPDSQKNGTDNYGSDATRHQYCFQIKIFPKKCMFYINEQGIRTKKSGSFLTPEYDFSSGISACSPEQRKALEKYLEEQHNAKPAKKTKKKAKKKKK